MTQTIQRDLLTESRLEMLTRFHSDTYPVVSLYLDLRPEERQGGRLRTKLKSMIRQSEADLAAESEERREAFKAAADRLLDMLTQESNLSGRGLAVYSAPALDLWQRFSLPVAVKDRLVVSDRPYLRPLLTLADEYERYLIILIDKQEARLFITYLGAIAEYSEVKDELAPHPRAGGLSAQKYQRHHDMHVLWHAKHTVEVAEQVWARELCERLVIGGTPEAVAELRRHLPRALAERRAGEISVPVDAPADAVLTAVLHVEEAVERRVEAARVEELLTAALGHGPGVLGLKDTLTAVVEGGVLILVVEEDFAHPGFECPNCGYLSMTEAPRCPLCDHEVDAQADVVERAGERALEEDGALEVLRGENRAALAGYGHIGALLRYRPAR